MTLGQSQKQDIVSGVQLQLQVFWYMTACEFMICHDENENDGLLPFVLKVFKYMVTGLLCVFSVSVMQSLKHFGFFV